MTALLQNPAIINTLLHIYAFVLLPDVMSGLLLVICAAFHPRVMKMRVITGWQTQGQRDLSNAGLFLLS